MCKQERPDAILPTMGGQTALNLAKDLAEVRGSYRVTKDNISLIILSLIVDMWTSSPVLILAT